MEYALNDRADVFGMEAMYLASDRGTHKPHRLAELIREFSEILPGCEDDLDLIKNHGKRIAHPDVGKIKRGPEQDITRGMALDSIQATHQVLRLIYGMSGNTHMKLK